MPSLYQTTPQTGTVSSANSTSLYSNTTNFTTGLVNSSVYSVNGSTGVTVNPTTGNVVVSIGQDVATTANVTFADVTATGNLSNNYFTLANSAGSNGQVLTTNGLGVTTWTTVSSLGLVNSVTGSGAGISVSPTTGAVVVSNTGVTSIVAGTNISISGATGAVTVNATNTTYNVDATSTTGGANLNLNGSDSTTDSVAYKGAGGTTVTRTDANTITISSTGSGGAISLNDLTDVTITGTPNNFQALTYDTGSNQWINGSGLSIYGTLALPSANSNILNIYQAYTGSGTIDNGFGVGMQFNVEDTSGNYKLNAAEMLVGTKDKTLGSESYYISLEVTNGGASSQTALETSMSDTKIAGDLTINNDQDSASSIIYAKTSGADSTLTWNGSYWIFADDLNVPALTIDTLSSIDTATLTTTSTATVALISSFRNAMSILINIIQGTNAHCVNATVLRTSASTAMITTYGEMYDNISLASFTADTSGGNIRLLITPTSSTSTLFTCVRTSLT